MQHGAGGKWYLNAESYSNEVAEKYNLREFLLEQYLNFEQMSVRKVAGFDPVGMDHTFRMPIIGRVVKRMAERMLHSKKPPSNPFRPEGHIGQVVPMEDAIAILDAKHVVEAISLKIEEQEGKAHIFREELRTFNFRGVKQGDQSLQFVETDKVTAGMQLDDRIWRIQVGMRVRLADVAGCKRGAPMNVITLWSTRSPLCPFT